MLIDLWERLADTLAFETEYTFYDSFRDIVEATARGDVDVAISNLTITQMRAQVVFSPSPGSTQGCGSWWPMSKRAGYPRPLFRRHLVATAKLTGGAANDRHPLWQPQFPARRSRVSSRSPLSVRIG